MRTSESDIAYIRADAAETERAEIVSLKAELGQLKTGMGPGYVHCVSSLVMLDKELLSVRQRSAQLAADLGACKKDCDAWEANYRELQIKLNAANENSSGRGLALLERDAVKEELDACSKALREERDRCHERNRVAHERGMELDACKRERDAALSKLKALPGDWLYDSSLETWFPVTARYLADIEQQLTEKSAQLDSARSDAKTAWASFDSIRAEMQALLDNARAELAEKSALCEQLEAVLIEVSNVFTGWHSDGTAWSQYDQSVWDKVTAIHRELFELLQRAEGKV